MVSLDDPAVRAAYDDEALPRMSFGDHLDELRKRLIYSLLAVVAAIVVVMPFKHTVQEIVIAPYRLQWQRGFVEWVQTLEERQAAGSLDKEGKEYLAYCLEYREPILAGTKEYAYLLKEKTGYPVPYTLFAIQGLEDMFVWMWVALLFAAVLAAPVVIWQIWAFVAAGLYQRERRIFYRYFPFMMLLLTGGVLFGYRVALPFSLHFLIGLMDPSQVGAMLSFGQFLNLELALTGAMGLVFQMPLVMVALQRVGLVTHKAYLKNWRMTVLLLFLVAALLTPPEPVSMLLMATPMLLLYGLGLVLTRFGRRHEAPAVEVSA
jgi:Tat protein translocase TatC